MKKLIFIVVLITFLIFVISCNGYNELNGANKQVIHLKASMTQYDISGVEVLKEVYDYDFKGNLITKRYSSADFSSQTDYIYNNNGKLTEERQSDSFEGKNEVYILKYDYDSNENLIAKTRLNERGEIISKISYEYDDQNRIIELRNEDSSEITSYIYNENGYSMILQYNYGDMTAKIKTNYELDSYGNVIYQAIYAQNSEDIIEQELFNNYNESNLLIRSRTYFFGEMVDSIDYEYSGALLIKKIMSDSAGIYQIEEFEYNGYSEIIKEIRRSKSGVIMSYIIFEYEEKI